MTESETDLLNSGFCAQEKVRSKRNKNGLIRFQLISDSIIINKTFASNKRSSAEVGIIRIFLLGKIQIPNFLPRI
jgi:hypothetical protein